MTIPAGDSGLLHFEFDSWAHGPQANGEISRQVFIVSNNPTQPEIVVEIIANALVQPTIKSFSRTPPTAEIRLTTPVRQQGTPVIRPSALRAGR